MLFNKLMYHTYSNCIEHSTEVQTDILIKSFRKNIPVSFPSSDFDESFFLSFESLKSNEDLELTELEIKHQP